MTAFFPSLRRAAVTLALTTTLVALGACRTCVVRNVTFQPTETMNPNPSSGAGSIVPVRLFFLTAERPFLDATIEELWKGEGCGETRIGDVVPHQVGVTGKALPFEVPFPKEAAFVGVVADFNAPDPDGWRAIATCRQIRRSGYGFVIDGSSIRYGELRRPGNGKSEDEKSDGT